MIKQIQEYRSVEYDRTHGSPFDRGSADSWYDRPRSPHHYRDGVRVVVVAGSPEHQQYAAGYDYNEESGDKKVW